MPDYPQLDWEHLYQDGITPWDDDSPWPPLARLVREVCPPGGSILEVGCGHGIDAIHLASLGYRVRATDLSITAIGRARTAAKRTGDVVDFQVEDFYTSLHRAGNDLLYEKGVMANASNAATRVEFSRIVASNLADGGYWISVSGNSDNLNRDRTGPDKRGYQRLSILEIARSAGN